MASSSPPVTRRLILVPAAPAPRRGEAIVRRFRLARLALPAHDVARDGRPCSPG